MRFFRKKQQTIYKFKKSIKEPKVRLRNENNKDYAINQTKVEQLACHVWRKLQ